MLKVIIGFILGLLVASGCWVILGLATSIFQRPVETISETQALGKKLIASEWTFKTDHAKSNAKQTIKFSEEGKVTGNAGCNTFGGNFSLQNNKIEISNITSTLRACEENIMEDEHHLLSHLDEIGKLAEVSIDGHTLTLTADDESITFTN